MNKYQKLAKTTAFFLGDGIIYCALGISGEAGEVADKVKKVIRDNNGDFTDERKEAIAYELGDILWYIANMSDQLGYSLKDIADMNIDKLKRRHAKGTLSGSGDDR